MALSTTTFSIATSQHNDIQHIDTQQIKQDVQHNADTQHNVDTQHNDDTQHDAEPCYADYRYAECRYAELVFNVLLKRYYGRN
jgi:hypothetical protein